MASDALICKDCGAEFYFTDKDKAFYEAQGFNPPKRCFPCRDKKKQKFAEREADKKVSNNK